MQNLNIEIAKFGSRNQIQSIGLRHEVLRKPLHLVFVPNSLLKEENDTHIVALMDNLVVGVMLLTQIYSNVLKMRQVAVSEKYQSKGIGQKMVDFAKNLAIENNCKKIELHARETAGEFYLNLGYEKVGEWFEEVGLGHWKMVKEL